MDPFGNRSLLTTPRCILVSILTWLVSSSVAVIVAAFLPTGPAIIVTLGIFALLVVTGVLYITIYRAVSRSVDHTEQRLAENKRILKTFALVYCTTLVFMGTLGVSQFVYHYTGVPKGIAGYIGLSGEMSVILGTMSNSLIYWWRLQEFRSAIMFLHKCKRPTIQPIGIEPGF